MNEYEKLKKKLADSCDKEDAREAAIRKKRAERSAIKKSGGGHAVAKALMPKDSDTDFAFGSNVPEESGLTEEAPRCMERVICGTCGVSHGFCAEITEDKEKYKMLPTGNETTTTRGKRQGGMEWIKPEDLTLQPKEAKILMVRYNKEGRFGARVELKLAFDGHIKYIGISPKLEGNSPNYRILTAAFGHDENDWIDQRIVLFLEKEDFGEQYFVRIDVPEDKTKSKRK